jgi:hypothetical protein
VGLIEDIKPVREGMEDIVTEAGLVIERINGLTNITRLKFVSLPRDIAN